MNATFTWDSLTGAYKLKLDIQWKRERREALDFIAVLKKLVPISDRDYEEKTYTWFIHERWSAQINLLLNSVCNEVTFIAKPVGEASQTEFIPVEQDLTSLSTIFGVSQEQLKKLPFADAQRLYRRKAMELHPDRNGGEGEAMSKLNEVWNRLKARKIFLEEVSV